MAAEPVVPAFRQQTELVKREEDVAGRLVNRCNDQATLVAELSEEVGDAGCRWAVEATRGDDARIQPHTGIMPDAGSDLVYSSTNTTLGRCSMTSAMDNRLRSPPDTSNEQPW